MDLVISRLCVCVSLLASVAVIHAATWSYDPTETNGPQNWGDADDSKECDEGRQSPIDLVDADVNCVTFDDFVFQGYDSEEDDAGVLVSISNLGHTARIQVDGIMRMSGGGLPTEYEVIQAHFHWGTFNQQGSEHGINGRLFPLELHIVHYAYQWYNFSTSDAVFSGNSEALAVLGILFEIGESENEYFDELITGVSNIPYEDDTHVFQEVISLSNLLPEDKSRFYRYNGSLTTPPCFQVVAWTVFADTVKISQSQMDHFRRLNEGPRNDSHITGNTYRPLQPWNDRVVYFSNQGVATTPCSNAPLTKPLLLTVTTVTILLLLINKM